MWVACRNPVRIFLWELTTSYWVLCVNYFFRKSWVFKCPESQNTSLKFLCAINIKLTITHSNKVWIYLIDIHTTDLPSICDITPEFEEVLQSDFACIFLSVVQLNFLLNFILLFFGVVPKTQKIVFIFFIVVIVIPIFFYNVNWGIVLVKNLLFVVLWLG